MVTNRIDASASGNSRRCVHNKREKDHGMEQARVLVTFVISNDCDKFQGVQYQVGIAAHKNSADK